MVKCVCGEGDPDFSFCEIVLLTSVSRARAYSGFLIHFYV